MNKTVNQLVKQMKEKNDDWEWYPTTFEITEKVAEHLATKSNEFILSILDIGCGNGAFFEKLSRSNYLYCDDYKSPNFNYKLGTNYKKYGIEKSNILAEQLPEDVILLGSDFYTNTLIDKKVDVIFCNPPYSDYETWAEKIILEGNAKEIILVIPSRWIGSKRIEYALKKRKFTADIIGESNFFDAERKARARVTIISIKPDVVSLNGRSYGRDVTDPFDVWFENTFKFNAEKSNDSYFEEQKKQEEKKAEIVEKGDTAEMLVKFYNEDMQKLYDNYRALEKLDADIFKELKVDIKMLKESLKSRLQGLKNVYWDMLFKKYDKLTCRLTTEGKKKVTQKLQDNTSIDFTLDNIFQLTLWIIRHSNTLYDEQLTDFFFKLCNTENIHRYKSNKRWGDDEWKYLKESCVEYGSFRKDKAKKILKNIQLDYRIICTDWHNFDYGWNGKAQLTESCIEFLYDLSVIADNLGFRTDLELPENHWEEVNLSDWSNFDIHTKDGELFCNVKLYKNGNRHLKFNPAFMQKLNVEMARINGWVQDKSEVEKEFGLTKEQVERVWKSNIQIGIGESKLLGLPCA